MITHHVPFVFRYFGMGNFLPDDFDDIDTLNLIGGDCVSVGVAGHIQSPGLNSRIGSGYSYTYPPGGWMKACREHREELRLEDEREARRVAQLIEDEALISEAEQCGDDVCMGGLLNSVKG